MQATHVGTARRPYPHAEKARFRAELVSQAWKVKPSWPGAAGREADLGEGLLGGAVALVQLVDVARFLASRDGAAEFAGDADELLYLAGQGALADAPVVPLRLSGAVNTRGSINLGGNGSVSPIPTRKGTLTVEHANPNPTPQLN